MKKLPPQANIEDKNLVFAECFASLRKSRGLTQRAIAEKLGITDRAVSKWETGLGTPKFSDTPVLASIFGFSELRRIIYSGTKSNFKYHRLCVILF